MNAEAVYYLLTILPILIFKLALLWAGVTVVRMGYELLLRGVVGDFKFQGGFKGVKADLISASPGLLFALLGVALLAVGALVDKPFSLEVTSTTPAGSEVTKQGEDAPPPLSPTPPGLKEK